MPTYEYECTACGHRFERFQSIKDAPVKRCPECKRKVRRMLGTGAGIIFKGSGFYATDYRSSSYTQKAKQESTSSTPSTDSSAKDSSTKKDSSTTTETKKK
jgi:putative FmdB family regulatory protein